MTQNNPTAKDWLILGAVTGVAGAVAKYGINYSLDKRHTLSLGSLLRIDGLARAKPRQTATTLAVSLVVGGLQGILLGRCASKMMEARDGNHIDIETVKKRKKREGIFKGGRQKQVPDTTQYDPSYIH